MPAAAAAVCGVFADASGARAAAVLRAAFDADVALPAAASDKAPTSDERHVAAAVVVDTKYYTAAVDVHTVVIDSSGEAGVLGDEARRAHEAAEALVLLYDAAGGAGSGTAALSATIGPYIRAAHGAAATQAADTQLVVGVGALEGQETDAPLAEWCYENGFEHVFVSDDPSRDAALWEACGEGSRRVRDALAVTAWSTMIRKPKGAPVDAQRRPGGGTDIASGASVTPGARDQGADIEPAERTRQAMAALEGALLEGEGPRGEGVIGGADEDGVERFEQLMGQLAAARDNAATLGDGERRDVAARLAMQMAAAFGLVDSDSESDGEAADAAAGA